MKVCVVVPITRRWAIPLVLKNLEQLDYGDYEVSLLIYVDSNDQEMMDELEQASYPKQITQIKFHLSGNQPPLLNKVAYRRNRIVAMKEDTGRLLPDCDYVFSFEDDTIIPSNAMVKLLNVPWYAARIGFTQGIQCGRWDLPMLGSWEVDDVNHPTGIKTNTMGKGVEAVSAGGFYCYATPADLYKDLPYSWHDECFGPDVMYGLEVCKRGLLCSTDYSIVCGHAQENGQVLYPNGRELELEWKLKKGQWMRQFTFLDLKNHAKQI